MCSDKNHVNHVVSFLIFLNFFFQVIGKKDVIATLISEKQSNQINNGEIFKNIPLHTVSHRDSFSYRSMPGNSNVCIFNSGRKGKFSGKRDLLFLWVNVIFIVSFKEEEKFLKYTKSFPISNTVWTKKDQFCRLMPPRINVTSKKNAFTG